MIAAVIAATCLIILAGLVYERPGDPSDETMASAGRTETSAQAAGAALANQVPVIPIATSGPAW